MIRLTLATALACSCLLSTPPSSARAEAVVGFFGTVEEGTLNGVDLAGAEFIYGGFISDLTDLDDVLEYNGTFLVEEAFLDFGDRGFFDFGPQESYFLWGLDERFPENRFFYGGFITDFRAGSRYSNGLVMIDNQSTIPTFDPNQLSTLEPYVSFDVIESYDVNVPFDLRNDSGDEISIAQFENSGGLFVEVVAVPEPSSCLAIGLVGTGWVLRRRKVKGRSDNKLICLPRE